MRRNLILIKRFLSLAEHGHLFSHYFDDCLGGFDAVHDWHLDIHQDELVNTIITIALFFEIWLVHLDGLLSIRSRINLYVEFFQHHVLDDLDVELLVIYYEDFFLTITTLLPRNSRIIFNFTTFVYFLNLLVEHLLHFSLDLAARIWTRLLWVTLFLGETRVDQRILNRF